MLMAEAKAEIKEKKPGLLRRILEGIMRIPGEHKGFGKQTVGSAVFHLPYDRLRSVVLYERHHQPRLKIHPR